MKNSCCGPVYAKPSSSPSTPHQCSCTSTEHPFHCPVFEKEMCVQEHQICQGTFRPEQQEIYLNLWKGLQSGQIVQKPAEYGPSGKLSSLISHFINWSGLSKFSLGTKLANLFSWMGFKKCGRCIRRQKALDGNPEVVRPVPKLTVGMCTYDDFPGVWATVNSLFSQQDSEYLEIIIVDNNPESTHGELLRNYYKSNPQVRYVPYTEATGTAQPRNRIFELATTPYVLVVDCHVEFPSLNTNKPKDIIRRLIKFYEANPETNDLYSGPRYKHTNTHYPGMERYYSSHQELKWSEGSLGTWAQDPRATNPDNSPFEIPQQGMGLFTCRREAWVKFHPEFRKWGGAETYIMEKFRARGDRVMCLPFLRWVHRFGRTTSNPPGGSEGVLRNYLIAARDLGQSYEPVLDHYRKFKGEQFTDRVYKKYLTEFELHPEEPRTYHPSTADYNEYIDIQIAYAKKRRYLTEERKPSQVHKRLRRVLAVAPQAAESCIAIGCRHRAEIDAIRTLDIPCVGVDLIGGEDIITADISKLPSQIPSLAGTASIAYCSHVLEHVRDFPGFYKALDFLGVKAVFVECPRLKKPDRRECTFYRWMQDKDPIPSLQRDFPDYSIHDLRTSEGIVSFVLVHKKRAAVDTAALNRE